MYSPKLNCLFIFIIGLTIISNCLADDSNLPYKEGELLIRFAPKAKNIQHSLPQRNQILSNLKAGRVKKSLDFVPGLALVKLPEGVKVKDVLSKLKSKSDFLYVEPNWKINFYSTPNDPNFPKQWGLNNTDANHLPGADIDAPRAWDIITDSNIIVAVLDTGIDYTHPDLAANMWKNPVEANGIPSVDDDNNGYIDDIHGWTFSKA